MKACWSSWKRSTFQPNGKWRNECWCYISSARYLFSCFRPKADNRRVLVKRQLRAEAVWKRAFLLISLSNQEMLDEAFH